MVWEGRGSQAEGFASIFGGGDAHSGTQRMPRVPGGCKESLSVTLRLGSCADLNGSPEIHVLLEL